MSSASGMADSSQSHEVIGCHLLLSPHESSAGRPELSEQAARSWEYGEGAGDDAAGIKAAPNLSRRATLLRAPLALLAGTVAESRPQRRSEATVGRSKLIEEAELVIAGLTLTICRR